MTGNPLVDEFVQGWQRRRTMAGSPCKKVLKDFLLHDGRGHWQEAPHLNHLCAIMQEVADGPGNRRVIVSMPPRHGKSQVCSKKFPAWFLGNYPDKEIIISSYSADLAMDFSRIARNTLMDHRDIFGIGVAQDSKAVGKWSIADHLGGCMAAGVGGPITGRGAHVLIIDDPFKNHEEAFSKTIRENVWNWYRTTARTRLAPNGSIVLIMTRWHTDDLAGKLLKAMAAEDGETWEEVKLAAMALDNDLLGRKPGEALWPERFPLDKLLSARSALGSKLFGPIYQQSPSPDEGMLFKSQYFRYYEREGDFLRLLAPEGEKLVPMESCAIMQFCDPAGSLKSSADYFCLATWAVTPMRDLAILDMVRVRIEGPDQPGLLKAAFARWKPHTQYIETKDMGMVLFQQLKRDGLPVKELKPDAEKQIRALPMAARYEAGSVYHPSHASWLYDFEEELLSFPAGAHDDQVDVTAYPALVLPEIGTGDIGYQSAGTRRFGRIRGGY